LLSENELSFLFLIGCGCLGFSVVAFDLLGRSLKALVFAVCYGNIFPMLPFFQGTKEVDNLMVLVLFQSMQYTNVSYWEEEFVEDLLEHHKRFVL